MNEAEISAPITVTEYEKAEQRAREKLRQIIEREGDADGARRTAQYINALIAEQVGQERYTAYTYQKAVEQIRDKKRAGIDSQPKIDNVISLVSIVSQIS